MHLNLIWHLVVILLGIINSFWRELTNVKVKKEVVWWSSFNFKIFTRWRECKQTLPPMPSLSDNRKCHLRYKTTKLDLGYIFVPGLPKSCKSVHLSAARTVPLTVVSEQVWNKPSWWYWTPSISLSSFHQTRQKSVASAKIPSRIAAKQLTKLVITLIIVF